MSTKHALATLIGTTTYPGASSPVVSGSMAAGITGNWIYLANKTAVTFEFKWVDTGVQDPVGLFGLEFSNEYHPQLNPNVTGTTITLASADTTGMSPATTSGQWAIGINLTDFPCLAMRPIYTRTSGAGTATCTAKAS